MESSKNRGRNRLKKPELTHLDNQGRAQMVDISSKPATARRAVAAGSLKLTPATLKLLQGRNPKGDVFQTARLAGITAAKKTHDLIPLCHLLPLSKVTVEFHLNVDQSVIEVRTEATTVAQTGVEMEALTSASVALLTLYDMLKSADKRMVISDIRLLEKEGGKSGAFKA
jgi:cyclic pyranopterin monophosphate synthase